MTTLTRADWEQRAKDLKIEGRAYINGEYTAAVSGDTFECLSPVDGRLLATVASCDVADAQRAVENARATFNSGAWSRLAPAKRKATMIRFAGLLKAMMQQFFEGHAITIRIKGKEVIDTNMTKAGDGKSAEIVIPFLDLINGTVELPPELYATVKVN